MSEQNYKMKTQELIAQAEEILSKCSEGPWKISNYRPYNIINRDPHESTYENGDNNFVPLFDARNMSNADFIVFARNHMPALLERLKRYETALIPFVIREAPCIICGYNGSGYYQPETHKCAKVLHETKDPFAHARKALEKS